MVNGHKHFSCDSDDRFFVAPALFQRFVFTMEIGIFPRAFCSRKRTLDEQGLQIMPAVPRPCGLLLPCACIICRRETRPAGKSGIILPNGHVCPNLTQDIQGGYVRDTYHRYQMVDDTEVFLTVIFQFFINQPDAFIQLPEM